MKFEEYRKLYATSLAALVKKKEVPGEELLQTAIARAGEVNPKINAVVTQLYGFGKQQLEKAQSWFGKVPQL